MIKLGYNDGNGCLTGERERGQTYLGHGIAPKIIWKLKDRVFMKAFKDKGRLSEVLAHIRGKVIMNDKAALLGEANYARRLVGIS